MDNSYVFISYAHRDSEAVLPCVQTMKQDGIHLWYDEGIEAGSEWPEFIAQKVIGCSKFVLFVSQAYLESQNCKRELNFAISRKKEILSVFWRTCRSHRVWRCSLAPTKPFIASAMNRWRRSIKPSVASTFSIVAATAIPRPLTDKRLPAAPSSVAEAPARHLPTTVKQAAQAALPSDLTEALRTTLMETAFSRTEARQADKRQTDKTAVTETVFSRTAAGQADKRQADRTAATETASRRTTVCPWGILTTPQRLPCQKRAA